MSYLLIDPPVGPWSSREAIERWLADLEAMRAKYAGDVEAEACIKRSKEEAERWLERKR